MKIPKLLHDNTIRLGVGFPASVRAHLLAICTADNIPEAKINATCKLQIGAGHGRFTRDQETKDQISIAIEEAMRQRRFYTNGHGPRIGKVQAEKGYALLKNLAVTPKGKERLRNPFDFRQRSILDHFSHFTWDGFHDGRPIYAVHSTADNFFRYVAYPWQDQTYSGKPKIVLL